MMPNYEAALARLPEVTSARIDAALVYATLAVADELRTANLIALEQLKLATGQHVGLTPLAARATDEVEARLSTDPVHSPPF